jgi:thiol-disulfide isomerase/thioredoxin
MQFNSNYLLALAGVMLFTSAIYLDVNGELVSKQQAGGIADGTPMPELSGAIGWLSSPALSRQSLRGNVVLVDFWTYTCINSLRPLPYVKAWAAKYKSDGLVVIGAHTPEFSFEKEQVNVQNAVNDLKISYPVAIDSNYAIWNAFSNDYWPAQYLIDANGRVRYRHFGEGDYVEIERAIKRLLREKGARDLDNSTVAVSETGLEAAPSDDQQSPETYVGYRKAERFVSAEGVAQDSPRIYRAPTDLSLNQWGLGGSWNVGGESAALQSAPGWIAFRFHSRDLNLVLAPAKDGTLVRFKVTLDGVAPENNHGADTAPDGSGEVREPRLYQLVRQSGPIRDRTFAIQFHDPGVHALDFTFG